MADTKNWFDPNAYAEMFKSADMKSIMDQMKVPGFDAEAISEAQNKNMQAFVDANRAAAEGFQQVFKKQMEIVQANLSAMTDAVKTASSEPMSAEAAEKRAESAKAAFEKAVKDMADLFDTARKANEQALTIVQNRFQEGVEELKSLSQNAVKAAA